MNRVGIVTIIDHRNFGNRLQNFALQEVIRALGHEVVTIRNTPRPGDGAMPIVRKFQTLRRRGLFAFVDKARVLVTPPDVEVLRDPRALERIQGNREFTQKMIRESEARYEEILDRAEFALGFSSFVVGSDQVWNPAFRLLNGIDFLTFAREEQRIAYAASIGISQLSAYDARRYACFLRGIPAISVREVEASNIVYSLTGRHVPVVLDPTMLISRDSWAVRATTSAGLEGPDYVAKFHLGVEDGAQSAVIDQYAQRRGLRVVDINDPSSEHYSTSPGQFLGAIRNARLVVTDSFHAAVFSTLFEVPYVTKGRGEMNSRLSTLMTKTGIRALEWASAADVEALADVDWEAVRLRVDGERAASLGFLRNSLGTPRD